jgi:hypothetical protein
MVALVNRLQDPNGRYIKTLDVANALDGSGDRNKDVEIKLCGVGENMCLKRADSGRAYCTFNLPSAVHHTSRVFLLELSAAKH